MVELDNEQRGNPKPKRHNANRCLFRVRQRIINELAWGNLISEIARATRRMTACIHYCGL